jgi:hypothetical protein
LRHPHGEQGIADDVLDRLPFLAGNAQQRAVITREEQHEAARPRHGFDPRPGRCWVVAHDE